MPASTNLQGRARTRFELRQKEDQLRGLRNQIRDRRAAGATEAELDELRDQIRTTIGEGKDLSLMNSAQRREALTRNEVAPRDIPEAEIQQAARAARHKARVAERLASEQAQQVQRQDQAALGDVQDQATAQRLGLTPEQARALRRLSTPVTPETLAAEADQQTANTITSRIQRGTLEFRPGRDEARPENLPFDPNTTVERTPLADLGDSPEAGEARIAALRQQLRSQPTPELSGRPTDPELARQFDAGLANVRQEEAEIDRQVVAERARVAERLAAERRRREAELTEAQHRATLTTVEGVGAAGSDGAPLSPGEADIYARQRAVEADATGQAVSVAEAANALRMPTDDVLKRIDKFVRTARIDTGFPMAAGATTATREFITGARRESAEFFERVLSLPDGPAKQEVIDQTVARLIEAGVRPGDVQIKGPGSFPNAGAPYSILTAGLIERLFRLSSLPGAQARGGSN